METLDKPFWILDSATKKPEAARSPSPSPIGEHRVTEKKGEQVELARPVLHDFSIEYIVVVRLWCELVQITEPPCGVRRQWKWMKRGRGGGSPVR